MFASDRGLRRFRVVSDSIISVQAVTNINEDYHYTGAIIHQIQILMSATQTQELCHIRRDLNSKAHVLARFASSIPNHFIWEQGKFPSWLEDIVF